MLVRRTTKERVCYSNTNHGVNIFTQRTQTNTTHKDALTSFEKMPIKGYEFRIISYDPIAIWCGLKKELTIMRGWLLGKSTANELIVEHF